MNKTFADKTLPFILAALMTLAMLAGTNALASHEYRVASDAASNAQPVALEVQHVLVVGHRLARA